MSIGNDPANKRHRAKNMRKVSSPGKVYHSRASKPSSVADLGAQAAVGTTDGSGGAGDAALAADVDARIAAMQAKIDELNAALKK